MGWETKKPTYTKGREVAGITITGEGVIPAWSNRRTDAVYPVKFACGHPGFLNHRDLQAFDFSRAVNEVKCPDCRRAEKSAAKKTQRHERNRARHHSEIPSLPTSGDLAWPAPGGALKRSG